MEFLHIKAPSQFRHHVFAGFEWQVFEFASQFGMFMLVTTYNCI